MSSWMQHGRHRGPSAQLRLSVVPCSLFTIALLSALSTPAAAAIPEQDTTSIALTYQSESDHEAGQPRQQVADSTIAPYRQIGVLQSRDGTLCTAAFVSDAHILTAGHCVFDYTGTHQIRDPNPRFWAAVNRNASTGQLTAPYVQTFVTNIQIPHEFLNLSLNEYDFAVLTLDQAVGSSTGWFDFGCFQNVTTNPTADSDAGGGSAPVGQSGAAEILYDLNVAGYPGDQDVEMFSSYCGGVQFNDEVTALVQHECNTYKGMSGSPLWSYNPSANTRTVCCVHKADAQVAGVDNLCVPLYGKAVDFITAAIADG